MPDDRRVLDGVTRLIVDGTNVLYAIRRSAAPLPAAALIGRLRAIVPPGVVITPTPGAPPTGAPGTTPTPGVSSGTTGQ